MTDKLNPQVCTGVMMHGYPLVKKLCAELQDFMREHNFSSIEEFRGYATTPPTMIAVFDMAFEANLRNYSRIHLLCYFYLSKFNSLPQSSKDRYITKP
jgi:hypothetical protein